VSLSRKVLLGVVILLLLGGIGVAIAGDRALLFRATFIASGTGAKEISGMEKMRQTVAASDFTGVDGCAQIQAALNALPSGGGIIDASMLTGTQACASNPVVQAGDATCVPSCPKPFKLKLGPSIWQVAVPWVFGEGGEAYHTGQMIEGCGIECTVLQPTSGFSGSVVLQIKPPGADVLVRQASFRDLTIDMNNVSGKTGVELLSVSNLPTISNVTVIRNNGRCLHIGPLSSSATIPEGVTLDTFNCYFKVPKTANGAELGNLNEFTWKNSKIMGSFDGAAGTDLNFIGVLIYSELSPGAPINTAGEAGQFPNTSIDSFDTGIKVASGGAWASAKNNLFTNMTMENLNIAFYLAGRDASNTTSGNILIGNRYLSTVPVHVKMDFADSNLIMESKINAGVGAYVLTANSLNNMLFRQFSQSNKSDVSDSGTGNTFLGWINGNGIQLGKGGAGATNTQVQIDSGATGQPQLQLARAETVKSTLQISDNQCTDGTAVTTGGSTTYWCPDGRFIVPSVRATTALSARVVLTYSATIATDASLGNTFSITATNGTAFTISNPTNLVSGQRVLYIIRNTSGGAHGLITWGGTFKTAAAALTVATANSKSIEFVYDGTNLIETFRSAADVAN
jgi:hypothetical protein